MGLSIKKSSWDPRETGDTDAPLQKSMWVSLSVMKPDEISFNDWKKYIAGREYLFSNEKTYKLVLSEPIELNVETEWTESAGADIAKKVNQIFNSKAIKIFAGAKASHNAPNDSWTQKTTEIGKPLSAKLKFRIYARAIDETNNKMQSYRDMIQFLILLCAPRKPYSLVKGIIDPLINAAQNSKSFFEKLKADSVTVTDEQGQEIKEPDEKASEEEKQRYKILKEQAQQRKRGELLRNEKKSKSSIFSSVFSNVRYNFTLKLTSALFNIKEKYESEMDWYVKSFNWKPSTEITYDNDKSMPFPLWVDFEVNLETCCAWPKDWIERILIS